jgi:fatty-acyl-CoA synthase
MLRSAGQPWGDVELRIVDPESGAALPDGSVGEIWIKSVQNMKGYWNNAEATREAFPETQDGGRWFRSGDAGYLEDGYLFIHDRVKDMIVSGGENVYPAEVENALMAHAGIADCAVIGVPDERWGETVKALIVPAPGADPSEAEVIAHCRERIARFKCPTSVERVQEIPRNPSGKILKTVLRKPYWEGRDRFVQ